jgi:hypothetical protein
MTTHARLSPSARYRWAACPASVNAIAKYEGKGGSSPSAIDGTHSHTLLEHCIKNNREPHSYIGLLLQDHEGMFGVDKDRADRVKIATDYIKTKVVVGAKVIAEQRVHPDALVGRDDMGGTVDVQIINGGHIEIIDYKDGMNPVKAEDNQQLEQYAYGILAGYLSAPQPRMFSKLTMTIVQPKIALKGGEPISSHSLDVTDCWANGWRRSSPRRQPPMTRTHRSSPVTSSAATASIAATVPRSTVGHWRRPASSSRT